MPSWERYLKVQRLRSTSDKVTKKEILLPFARIAWGCQAESGSGLHRPIPKGHAWRLIRKTFDVGIQDMGQEV
jgi:hypothetical protein